MQIESRIPDITQQAVQGSAGDVASRQRSAASGPSGTASEYTPPQAKLPGGGGEKKTTRSEAIDLQVTLEKLNELVKDQQRDVAFSVDKKANTTVIKFFKTKTGELIKQFPPEEILAMKAKLRENTGWLVDTKA
jgi:flagellar protein FlaG